MVYQYRRSTGRAQCVLHLTAHCNGAIQLMGIIPKGFRSNVHCAMQNSRYDFCIDDDTGQIIIHITRTKGKTCEEQLEIVRECATRLGKRAEIEVVIIPTVR